MSGTPKAKRNRGSVEPGPLVPRAKAGQRGAAGGVPKTVAVRSQVQGHVRFSFERADLSYDGSWSWCTDAEASALIRFVVNIEKSTWTEVAAQQTGGRSRHRKHHSQPVDSLCKEATDRLGDLGYDETFGDEIYRFRLGGTVRLWGFVVDGVFYVVWWDRDHKVYPTEKD